MALLKFVPFLSCCMAIYRYEADSPYPEALEIGDPALNDFPTTDFAEMDAAEGI